MHVRTQYFRNHNGTVSLLIVFQNSRNRTAYSQTGAIQCMDVFRFCLRRTAETDVGPPCLEIFRIGAGRNFAVFSLC